ncbi:uracil-DNA glycosylase family protein [Flavihumibacter profundi]|uniref:uracil-DNA glycosylase family protein n=1 Tax=Flavihumibacter profundi TaxID=2716883 RepID=UPI001CC6D983|nr:uracil-DNA glycosylase family protein [Flavihumibacter profundi]MBZ5857826.1 DUF4918 family protein [Flavihumibacter profundi]
MASFAQAAIAFFAAVQPPPRLPKGIKALYPHKDPAVQQVIREFFNKYYSDKGRRYMLIGINPGRFGAGITGINFTAPRQLREECGIEHSFGNSSELSAEFIYTMVNEYGGPEKFFRHFYIGSVSPIGFLKEGKNLNYYDDPKLAEMIRPFATRCLQQQLDFGIYRKVAICIGGDKNYRYLKSLNDEFGFFKELLSVPHPRFIMQYRRSSVARYYQEYLAALSHCLEK